MSVPTASVSDVFRVPPGKGVVRFLPRLLRKAGRKSAAWFLARALGIGIEGLDRTAKEVLKAHFLDDLDDLDDAARLAAWFRLSPWPEEDLAAFRQRLRQVVQVLPHGAANAERMLTIVGAAAGARIDTRPDGCPAFFLPGSTLSGMEIPDYLLDRFTAGAVLIRAATPTSPVSRFPVFVETMPPQRMVESIPIAEGGYCCRWTLRNSLTSDPEHWAVENPEAGAIVALCPERLPEPRIQIKAGANGLYTPAILQLDRQRLVLLNLVLPPWSQAIIDLETRSVTASVALGQGPLRLGGQPAPDLLFGAGGVVEETQVAPGPGDWQIGAPIAHTIAWYRAEQLADCATDPLRGDQALPAQLPWPQLLGRGESRWGLLLGQAIPLEEGLDVDHLSLVRPDPNTAPEEILVEWTGRCPGTFSLRFDTRHLSPDSTRCLPHRLRWLQDMVEQTRLAGTVLLPEPKTTQVEGTSNLGLTDHVETGCCHFNEGDGADVLVIHDHVDAVVQSGAPPSLAALSDALGIQDEVHFHLESGQQQAASDTLTLADSLCSEINYARTLRDQVLLGDAWKATVKKP